MTDAERIIETMARHVAERACKSGVVLAQEKYTTVDGLLLVVGEWMRHPHRVKLTWWLTPERGKPGQEVTEEEAQALIERRLHQRREP